MPKSASARISWWIPHTVSTRFARGSGTFWPRLLRCRGGGPDSLITGSRGFMREIVLDTETTGLDPLRGDRLVEIGCIEIFNRMPTGQTFHRYINPERAMPAEAYVALIGARQPKLTLASETGAGRPGEMPRRQRETPLVPRITDADREAHRAFIATLGAKPIWNDFLAAGL